MRSSPPAQLQHHIEKSSNQKKQRVLPITHRNLRKSFLEVFPETGRPKHFLKIPTAFGCFFRIIWYNRWYKSICGIGISVLCGLPKAKRRVRLPYPAPCKKPFLSTGQKRFFTMISVPVGTGDISSLWYRSSSDDICLRHMKERILYHTCEAGISYGLAVYHIASAT